MKIRSKEELSDRLNNDLAWRKKELSTLLNDVNTAPIKKKPTALRSAIVLLYAHWEGFIKLASETYLSYVKSKKLTLKELDKCFIALSLKHRLKEFESSNKSTIHTKMVDYLFNYLHESANFHDQNVILTNSNLNYSTLREILTTIGIDCSPYELKEKLIDSKLLKFRNSIAHGQELLLTKEEYQVIHNEIFNMINEINNRIQNAALNQSFKNLKM